MSKPEKLFVIFAILYNAGYAVFFFNFVTNFEGTPEEFFNILPFHFLAMGLNVALLIVVIRDIYKRDFEDPNAKLTWTLLIFFFAPFILVYLPKIGFKPRDQIVNRDNLRIYLMVPVLFLLCIFGAMGYLTYAMFHVAGDDIQGLAISGQNERIVKLLKEQPELAKAIRERDHWTPVHGAAYNNHPETVKILAEHDADLNVKNILGETALHGATDHGYLEVVRVLLEAGADPNLQNKKGKTPLDIAKWNDHAEIISLLESHQ